MVKTRLGRPGCALPAATPDGAEDDGHEQTAGDTQANAAAGCGGLAEIIPTIDRSETILDAVDERARGQSDW